MKQPQTHQQDGGLPLSTSDLFSVLRATLDRHDEWIVGRFTIHHKPSGIQLWIGNGWLEFTGYEGRPCHIPFWKRRRLWKHAARLRDSVTIKLLSENETNPATGSK